jgi:hypothetical protein
VVWLTKQRVYALPRYAECKAVLRDDTTFISGEGVGLNRISNRLSRGTTLNSDGDEHDQRRKLIALPNVINEVLRHESPLRAFSRKSLQPNEIAGIGIPAGSRVLVPYASATAMSRSGWRLAPATGCTLGTGAGEVHEHLSKGTGAVNCLVALSVPTNIELNFRLFHVEW